MSKIALVTGAGSGIGRQTALELVRNDWRVVLVGRREQPLTETESLANQIQPDRTLVLAGDVSKAGDVERVFHEVEAQLGRLDLLFNNAGINVPATPTDELTVEDWQRVVNVNLTGVFLCTRAAFGLMKRQQPQGGRIINNGSVSAHIPRPQSIAYTATKHAVTGMTRSTSLDGRAYNIACGQIDIGNASTDMTGRMAGGVLQADGSVAPEPTMHVDNVSRAIAYMASLPLDANVPFLTVMANEMPYIGRG